MCERGMLAAAFELQAINSVAGDYFEFGLWRGKTFTYAQRMKRRFRRQDMILWGFDSFAGLPAVDDPRDNVWSEGEFACSEHEFRRVVKRAGFSDGEFKLVPGFYESSLNADTHRLLTGRTASIVYVDCDLYSSTVQVMNFVARYL